MIRLAIERIILGSRWLLVPLYVTLVLSLLELLVQAAVKLQSATISFWSGHRPDRGRSFLQQPRLAKAVEREL
jgi:hypothetical protein